jgi:O-Antigen ligase
MASGLQRRRGSAVTEKAERTDAREGWDRHKEDRRPGRLLSVFKAVVLLALVAVTAYGMLRKGLYLDNLWLPVAAGILALLLATLFVGSYYRDVPRIGWVLVGLLAALVGVKGLSMIWTISETETIKEVLRSSMYAATFLLALAALSSVRQVGPLIDAAILIVTAVAGYGLLQKIDPVQHLVTSYDSVRVSSTLEYANTTALILAMGVVLALARMGGTRNAPVRGLYAALTLAFLITLYLTVSRGGIASLGMGMVALIVLTSNRLQTLTNLLLLSVPGVWLLWRIQDLDGLMQRGVSDHQEIADGAAFRTDLLIALAAAFVLQAVYALLADRYELMPVGRRTLGALAGGVALVAVCAGALVVVNSFGGLGQTYETLVSNPSKTDYVSERLASLDIGNRGEYWAVAWEEWKEHPLTGTGAGTFQFTWIEERPIFTGVKQVHNLYLEQGTETGLFAFVAFVGFCGLLLGHIARATWRSDPAGQRRLLLSGLATAMVVYLVSSTIEWHWYIPPSTLFFFVLAGVATKLASKTEWDVPEKD